VWQLPTVAQRDVGGGPLTQRQRMRDFGAAASKSYPWALARPTGSGVRHVGHLDVLHVLAGPWGVNDLPAACVEAHMADVAVEEHQIAELEIRFRHRYAAVVLLPG
jgi:hypothetical protein